MSEIIFLDLFSEWRSHFSKQKYVVFFCAFSVYYHVKSIKNAGNTLLLSGFCLRSEYFYFETKFVSNKHDYRPFHLSENIVHQAITHITLSDPIKFWYITQFFVIFLFFIKLSLIQDHPQLFSLIHSEAEME